jgi:mono/diheme cytochrome c family protein
MSDTSTSSDTSLFVRPAPSTVMAFRSLKKVPLPLWFYLVMITGFFLGILALFIPIEMRTNTHKKEPRIHFIQDMDNQPKFKAQQSSLFFADGRANRPPVPGTVARGELAMQTDLAYYEGYTLGADGKINWVGSTGAIWPKQVEDVMNDPAKAKAFLDRGQYFYNYTCINCHGADGSGNGPIHQRAKLVGAMATGWNQPTNLASDSVKARPNGHLYATINRGIKSMGPVGHIITDPHDRWAVVAYVRALELSRGAPESVKNASGQ